MDDKLIFWALFLTDKGVIVPNKKVTLTADIADADLTAFLHNELDYENGRRTTQKPFFKSIPINADHRYVLALRPDANSNMNNTLKGIEDHIKEHLSTELPDDEWKRRAIKILLTWNISEKRELVQFTGDLQEIEKQQKNYGLISLVLAALAFIVIQVMKK